MRAASSVPRRGGLVGGAPFLYMPAGGAGDGSIVDVPDPP